MVCKNGRQTQATLCTSGHNEASDSWLLCVANEMVNMACTTLLMVQYRANRHTQMLRCCNTLSHKGDTVQPPFLCVSYTVSMEIQGCSFCMADQEQETGP